MTTFTAEIGEGWSALLVIAGIFGWSALMLLLVMTVRQVWPQRPWNRDL